MTMHDDLKHLADPNCPKCYGNGRYADYSEDEWGMVMWIKCNCVKKAEVQSNNPNAADTKKHG